MSDPNQPPSAPQVPPAYQSPPAPPAPGYPAAPVTPAAPVPPVATPVAPAGAPVPPYGAPQPAPGYQAPPGAYGVPVGGYAPAPNGYAVPSTQAPASSTLGLMALLASLVAAIITPIVAGIMVYQIGLAAPEAVSNGTLTDTSSLAFLSPVRDQVLWAEISFWAGTLLGIFAIVAGIIAIVKQRGRGQGIAGVVVAAIAPGIFFTVVLLLLSIGASAGAMNTFGSL